MFTKVYWRLLMVLLKLSCQRTLSKSALPLRVIWCQIWMHMLIISKLQNLATQVCKDLKEDLLFLSLDVQKEAILEDIKKMII